MATEQPVTLKKKLPFKRTVARKVQPDPETETPQKAEDDNGLDLFRHSEEVFATVLREKEEEALREESTLEKHHSKRRKVSVDRSPKRCVGILCALSFYY
jgi:flagellar motor protein MotB